MNHAKLLDCTLRDGAYLIDKKFGNNVIHGIIDGLVKARIDYIEVGFLQNDGFEEGKTVFKNSEEAKRFIPDNKYGTVFTALADYSRYSIENLDRCTGNSLDAVRECFLKNERYDAIDNCRWIKELGYKVFVQPVDILGYSDIELIEFLYLVNEVEPYCLSIVDTFGSMYQEDLHRIFELINHNLIPSCRIGFHSHNNMQMSSALSQEFIRMSLGKRKCIVDGTISGMGRGAGNTPIELIAQYMVSQFGYSYDLDVILDIIDVYMDNIKSRCSWGYNTPFFVAGCYSAHVNNIQYLTKKNSIKSKDIRYILNRIGAKDRKKYDYDLLERTYLEYMESDIDDSMGIEKLEQEMNGKDILIIAPGKSSVEMIDVINVYINKNDPLIISVNFIHDSIVADYIYMSNQMRYAYWLNDERFRRNKKIIVSNIKGEANDLEEVIISFNRLIKCGWENMDNSMIMLLRLLDFLKVKSIAIAGFDGYDYINRKQKNYALPEMELSNVAENPMNLNMEIFNMMEDYMRTRTHKEPIFFITPSKFDVAKNKIEM